MGPFILNASRRLSLDDFVGVNCRFFLGLSIRFGRLGRVRVVGVRGRPFNHACPRAVAKISRRDAGETIMGWQVDFNVREFCFVNFRVGTIGTFAYSSP